MAIKPVDMQVMLPKLYEVARIQGTDAERQAIASQRGDIDTRSMVDANVKEVHAKKNAQRVNFREKKEDEEEKRKKKNEDWGSGRNKEKRHANSDGGNGDALDKDKGAGKITRSQFIDIKL